MKLATTAPDPEPRPLLREVFAALRGLLTEAGGWREAPAAGPWAIYLTDGLPEGWWVSARACQDGGRPLVLVCSNVRRFLPGGMPNNVGTAATARTAAEGAALAIRRAGELRLAAREARA